MNNLEWSKAAFRWNYIMSLEERVSICEQINNFMIESYDIGMVLNLDIMYCGFFKLIVLHEVQYTEMYVGYLEGGRVKSLISLAELA